MTLATLIAFTLALLAALASPGPAFIAMLRSSFAGGRGAALRTGIGLALGAVIWSVMALLGLQALFAAVPAAYLFIKIAGAGYLIWLAIAMWRHADAPVDGEPPKGLRGFRLGLATNLANPKAVVFIAAIFTTILPQTPTLADSILILIWHFGVEAIWYSGAALLLTTPVMRNAYMRAKARIDRIAAAALGVMALRIAN